MKTLLISLLAITSSLFAANVEEEQSTCDHSLKGKPIFEVKGGYFFFQNSTLNKIYDSGAFDFQLSTSFPFIDYSKFQVKGYLSVEFLLANGKSLNGDAKTTLLEVPVSLGIKPTFTLTSFLKYYFAFGPRYFYVHQRNHSDFVDKRNNDHVFGGFLNTGFDFFIYSNLILDVFGEYSYGMGSFSSDLPNVFSKKSQVGGFTFGLGLGWSF